MRTSNRNNDSYQDIMSVLNTDIKYMRVGTNSLTADSARYSNSVETHHGVMEWKVKRVFHFRWDHLTLVSRINVNPPWKILLIGKKLFEYL